MKKYLIKNISTASLEFLVKDNNEDVLMSLQPGESGYADFFITNSMRIFERKNLITFKEKEYTSTVDEDMDINNDETLDNLHITKTTQINIPTAIDDTITFQVFVQPPQPPEFIKLDFKIVPTGSDFNSTEWTKEEEKKEKSYKGKKRGRKKKRGPKPGNKKKKDNSTITEENNKNTGITGCTY